MKFSELAFIALQVYLGFVIFAFAPKQILIFGFIFWLVAYIGSRLFNR